MNSTTTEQEKREGSHRAYRLPMQDQDDLRMLIAHLPGFMDTAEANERQMVVEVWYCHKPTS